MTRSAVKASTIGCIVLIGRIAAGQDVDPHQPAPAQAGPAGRPAPPSTIPSTIPLRPVDPRSLSPQAVFGDPAKNYSVEPQRLGGNARRAPAEEELFERAANALRQARPLPSERVRFFGWLDQPDSPLVRYGWYLNVRKVTSTPAGWLITVSVSPKTLRGGSHATVYNSLAEEYVWSDGMVRFVRAYPLTTAEPAFGW